MITFIFVILVAGTLVTGILFYVYITSENNSAGHIYSKCPRCGRAVLETSEITPKYIIPRGYSCCGLHWRAWNEHGEFGFGERVKNKYHDER